MTEGSENVVPLRAARNLRLVETGAAPVRERGDEALMLDHAAGEEAAFAELVRRHQKGVLNYMFRMVQNRQIAEELTQEVFLALVRNAERYQPTAKFTTYMYTIASNMVCKEWSRQRRRPRLFSLSAWWQGDEEDSFDPLEHMADARADVQGAFQREEISTAVNDALRHLPDHQREAFVLRRYQDLSYEEIAEICDVPVGTVKSRVVRAERALRPHLERFREYLS
jgi:RNA polymerase sigma-70 factor (ECF subfamily)